MRRRRLTPEVGVPAGGATTSATSDRSTATGDRRHWSLVRGTGGILWGETFNDENLAVN